MAPSWLHDESIDKSQAEVLLNGKQDGAFLFRARGGGASGFIISVVYKGKPTHHLAVKPEGQSSFVVNKKSYGTAETVEQLAELLATKGTGWPAPLTQGIDVNGNAVSSAISSANGDDDDGHDVVQVHPNMTTAQAKETLDGMPSPTNGDFFISKRSETEFVLAVRYKGKPTVHKLIASSDGTFKVNSSVLANCSTLEQVVAHLRTAHSYWPVPLMRQYTTEQSLTQSSITTAPSKITPTSTPVPPAATTTSTSVPPATATASVPQASFDQVVLYPALSIQEASGKLNSKATPEDGDFLLSKRSDSEYVLCVRYKGKPTCHKVLVTGDHLQINKTPLPSVSTIQQLREHLAQAHPFWPAPLLHQVTPPASEQPKPAPDPTPKPKAAESQVADTRKTDPVPTTSATSAEPTPAPVPEPQPTSQPTTIAPAAPASERLQDALSTKPSSMFQPLGVDEARTELNSMNAPCDGDYLFSKKDDTTYLLVVRYKGKATCHKVTQSADHVFTINKTALPSEVSSIEQVETHLKTTHPYWPIALQRKKTPTQVIEAPQTIPMTPAAAATPAPATSQSTVSNVPPAETPASTSATAPSPERQAVTAAAAAVVVGATSPAATSTTATTLSATTQTAETSSTKTASTTSAQLLQSKSNTTEVGADAVTTAATQQRLDVLHALRQGVSTSVFQDVNPDGLTDEERESLHAKAKAITAKWLDEWNATYDQQQQYTDEALEEPEADSDHELEISDMERMCPFFHHNLTVKQVHALLEPHVDTPGTFLLFDHEGLQKETSNYTLCVLSVTFRGQVTHHQISSGGPGHPLILNNAFTRATTIPELLRRFSTPQPPFWPAKLTKGIQSGVAARQIAFLQERKERRRERAERRKLFTRYLQHKIVYAQEREAARQHEVQKALERLMKANPTQPTRAKTQRFVSRLQEIEKVKEEHEAMVMWYKQALERDARAQRELEERRKQMQHLYQPTRLKRSDISKMSVRKGSSPATVPPTKPASPLPVPAAKDSPSSRPSSPPKATATAAAGASPTEQQPALSKPTLPDTSSSSSLPSDVGRASEAVEEAVPVVKPASVYSVPKVKTITITPLTKKKPEAPAPAPVPVSQRLKLLGVESSLDSTSDSAALPKPSRANIPKKKLFSLGGDQSTTGRPTRPMTRKLVSLKDFAPTDTSGTSSDPQMSLGGPQAGAVTETDTRSPSSSPHQGASAAEAKEAKEQKKEAGKDTHSISRFLELKRTNPEAKAHPMVNLLSGSVRNSSSK
eukprot:m.139684 g.139684  ORF g.139684 m.139684 type:complete len:1260 (-) comp14026_c0_seq2:430-4209(-)